MTIEYPRIQIVENKNGGERGILIFGVLDGDENRYAIVVWDGETKGGFVKVTELKIVGQISLIVDEVRCRNCGYFKGQPEVSCKRYATVAGGRFGLDGSKTEKRIPERIYPYCRDEAAQQAGDLS